MHDHVNILLTYTNMNPIFHVQPNGRILFRDYAIGDLAQVKF